MDFVDNINTETQVLMQLREEWRLKIEGDGGYCPCCDRWGKIYRRSINASMARALLWLSQQADRGDGWVHVPSIAPAWLLRSNQLATLHLWGLVVSFDPSESKLTSSGLWKITQKGTLFTHNTTYVPKYAYVYNNRVEEFEGPEVSISDCLGDKFDYHTLLVNFSGEASDYDEDSYGHHT